MATKEGNVKDLMGHVLQVLYTIFLGILVAVFCGLGIDTFYPGPKTPEYPSVLQQEQYKTAPVTQTSEELTAQKDFDSAMRQFEKDRKPYTRNASMIAVVLAVVALALSLTVLIHWEVIANGVLLGGVFTLGYSLILGMQSDDTKFRFFLVTAAVAIAFALGYMKFIKPAPENKS
jgi:hypothetical protein